MTDGGAALRDYQQQVLRRWQVSQARRSLIVLPTATGKSFLLAAIVWLYTKLGCRVLVLAHRREILHQLFARIVEAGAPEDRMGLMLADDPRRDDARPVQVASVDTFRRGEHATFDIIVIDEAHRSTAATYRAIIEAHPNARIVGFTATPERLDGDPLGDLYDELIVGPMPSVLIGDGWIARPRVFTAEDAELPALRGLRRRGADFDPKELGEQLESPKLSGSIVRDWETFAKGQPTVAFAVTRKHADAIAARFRASGVASEVIDQKTPHEDRDAVIGRLTSGETLVVVNVEVLTEGWDAPCVRCVILARPTLSLRLFLQMVGRGMRLGEERPIILDHARNVYLHGMPEADREWSLKQARERASTERAPKAWRCAACGAVSPVEEDVCRECGAARPERAPAVRTLLTEDQCRLVERIESAGLVMGAGVRADMIADRLSAGWPFERAVTEANHQLLMKLLERRIEASGLPKGEGLTTKRVYFRVCQGVPFERAVTMPFWRRHTEDLKKRIEETGVVLPAGVTASTVRRRTHKLGWSLERATTTPKRLAQATTDSVARSANDAGLVFGNGVTPHIARRRMVLNGWPLEEAVTIPKGSVRPSAANAVTKRLLEAGITPAEGVSHAMIRQRLNRGWSIEQAAGRAHRRDTPPRPNAAKVPKAREGRRVAGSRLAKVRAALEQNGLAIAVPTVLARLRMGWTFERATTTPTESKAQLQARAAAQCKAPAARAKVSDAMRQRCAAMTQEQRDRRIEPLMKARGRRAPKDEKESTATPAPTRRAQIANAGADHFASLVASATTKPTKEPKARRGANRAD